MATVKVNTDKNGTVISYRWRACVEDGLGGYKRPSRTVPPPKDLTPGKALKQMQHDADEWEKNIRAGIVPVDTQSFAHFINEEWWKSYVLDGAHKDASIGFYKQITTRIIERLGHKDLADIKSTDIQAFINWLRTDARQENTGSAARFFLNRLGVKTPDEITDTAVFIEKAKAAKAKGQPWYRKFAAWYKKPLAGITPDDLRRYVAKLQAEDAKPTDKPLSAATVKHYYKTLAVIFNYAERHNRIERNPMRKVNPSKMEHHDVDFLAPEQAKRSSRH